MLIVVGLTHLRGKFHEEGVAKKMGCNSVNARYVTEAPMTQPVGSMQNQMCSPDRIDAAE